MPFCTEHKIFFKTQCSSCVHEKVRDKEDKAKIESKREKQLLKAKLQQSQPKKTVKKVSEKRKEENAEYSKIATQFKKENPICAVRVNEYCTGKTESVHHKRGRGKYLLEVSTFLPCCISCHSYIEAHPEEAKEKGWSESRLAIDQSKQTI